MRDNSKRVSKTMSAPKRRALKRLRGLSGRQWKRWFKRTNRAARA